MIRCGWSMSCDLLEGHQDGHRLAAPVAGIVTTVSVPLWYPPDDGLGFAYRWAAKEADPLPANAVYASGKTHGLHRDDGAGHDECREYVVGKCVLRSTPDPLPANAVESAVLALVATWEASGIGTHEPEIQDAVDALRRAMMAQL